MWLQCHHKIYRPEHGGFFGHKDQVELALHILRSSTVLEAMKMDSRVKIAPGGPYASPAICKTRHYLDGYVVAAVFVQGADRDNVVQVSGAIKYRFAVTDGRARFLLTWEPEF